MAELLINQTNYNNKHKQNKTSKWVWPHKKGFLVQKANVHTGSHAWSCMSNLMLLPEGEEK